MTKQAISKGLWVPICTPKRGPPWVSWICVRSTRREAKAALLDGIHPAHHKEVLDGVRFARSRSLRTPNDHTTRADRS